MTLYRKHRPQTFAEVAGQEAVKQILLEELKSGRLAHAYLFSGPRGTGKTTVARLLAKSLNCAKREKDGEACGQCQSCKSIAQGRSQDLVEMDAASNRGIDEIRELREQVKYVPANAPYKVYILDEAHMLTDAAFNALLKTLEEPPAHALFILATTELHKIKETVFSRCQHFAFKKLPLAQIAERLENLCKLEKVSVEAEVLEEIARRAGGAVRDAEGLLGQIIATGRKKITSADAELFLPKVGFSRVFGWLTHLVNNRADEALRALQTLEQDGVHLEFFLRESLEFARLAFLYKATGDEENLQLYFSPDEIGAIKDLVKDVSLTRLRTGLIELLRASQDMKLSPDLPILPIELAVVAICEPDKPGNKPVILTPHLMRGKNLGGKSIENHQSPPLRQGYGGQAKTNHQENSKIQIQNTKIPNYQSTLELIAKRHNNPISDNNRHTLADILSGWGEVMARVRDKNQALNFMLSVAQPVAVNGDTVELAFKYRLQQERVSETNNQMIVEEAMGDVFGAKYRLSAKLREDIKIGGEKGSKGDVGGEKELPALSDEELLTRAAMQVFEGAVVEG